MLRDYGMRGYTRRSMDACNPTAFINSPRRHEPAVLRMLPDGQLPSYLLAPDEAAPERDGEMGRAGRL